ncbi:hypothetical protein O181_036025 [Austropuccinia psidii MF-1]|uniref:Tf2-1-like SH3-like domain-containing protein n=1 Tax=Austropuccinia psidii MF-1 TaxID=1389203 RepID=A0A9Q3D837_9BASI|nr:hypothetical protein [Austropuccinia psidii MF-1]
MGKISCEKAEKFVVEAKLYNKQRYDKSHQEPDIKEGEKVLISTLNFNNLQSPSKMRDSFVRPFTIIILIGKNAVEFRLTEEFSRKHPVFPVHQIKQYHKTNDEAFTNRKQIVNHEKLV